MGIEVSQDHFSKNDFSKFQQKLNLETDYLLERLSLNQFSNHPPVAGFELEACLVDSALQPTPINTPFLERVDHAMFTSELAKFNIEINTTPQALSGQAFQQFEDEIQHLIIDAQRAAKALEAQILFTGILPTLAPEHFCIENMSEMKRYHALNEQILRSRQGKPLHFDLQGHEALHMQNNSVMLESAATSMQLHLQAPIEDAHHYYNASILASAAVTAVSCNSPYLFGNELWHETRIPIFEQSVHLGNSGQNGNTSQRVSFGSGYINNIAECFIENRDDYPVILPMLQDKPVEKFAHLNLHNGTIWRWNRPIVGFDSDGTPHIRIEHRVMPAGPTTVDMIANAAFFYGLTQYFATYLQQHEMPIPFQQAKDNFYTAARHGLSAKIQWDNQTVSVQELLLADFIPYAKQGLQQLQIDQDAIDHYLSIIQARVKSGQTGAAWQMNHVRQHGCSMQQLTQDYFQLQKTGNPVHTWPN